MDFSTRQQRPATDWVSAFEQARSVVAELGLDQVLALPPSQLVAGLRAWRITRSR